MFCVAIFVSLSFSQVIPDDPDHGLRKIGGEPTNIPHVDAITVSGKVSIDGLPSDQKSPAVFVAAYSNGRLVARKAVSDRGSYIINDVPRGESLVVVEIDHEEIASRQLHYTPGSNVYQDFSINWSQYQRSKGKAGVLSASAVYPRSKDDQDRFEQAVSDISKGKNDQAIAKLKVVAANDPKDFAAWSQLGNAYFLKKDTKNAESSYLRSLSERPNYTAAAVNLGKLYLSQNAPDKAIELLTKTVETDPTSADAQQYLGEGYLAIKKGSKAVGYLNEAIRLAPIEKAEIHLRLAALYNGAGLKPRASAEYVKFLEKVPNYERRDELKKYIAENPPGQ